MQATRAGRIWDAWAASLTGLCMLHCLVVPLIASLMPVVPALFENEWVHISLVALATPITLWVVWHAISHRESMLFVAVALVGITLMISALLLECGRR